MDLICDTNVWYRIAFGQLDPKELKKAGHRLIGIPTSVMEFVSSFNEDNFGKSKAIGGAFAKHADVILEDTEHFLAGLWGISVPPLGLDWREICTTIDRASTFKELTSGVLNVAGTQKQSVKVDWLRQWRESEYVQFEQDVWKAIDTFVPGYEAARQAKNTKYMDRAKCDQFKKDLQTQSAIDLLLHATHQRASLHIEPAPTAYVGPTNAQMQSVSPKLNKYVQIYYTFIYDCATKRTPSPNDFGDLECFLYADTNRGVITFDEKWHELSCKAGLVSALGFG